MARLKSFIWLVGIPLCIFGMLDRGISIFADNYVSFTEFSQVFVISLLLLIWLYLKPGNLSVAEEVAGQGYLTNLIENQDKLYLSAAQTRMLELKDYHLISQRHILPFPYLCQIYHLLNLKHLEMVHSFSLNDLKVVEVGHLRPTRLGGALKFKTILDSPLNVLKIWRQPTAEAELVLHTPYTIELKVPAYGNKRIIVIFNVVPISHKEHELLIDIYSNLGWPKSLLQVLLHAASYLTLYEDLPYLARLSQKSFATLTKASSHETMSLFKRFVDLYSSHSCLATEALG
ncbi:hypothetical protein [Pantanalinema sp. GBBB05]|uniref:hypothetical protein n=1 Tax=Pantanalinema sp. GBBB05 TaxID=2604139 RepID=UPI001D35AC4C|nr:hypothetical protein [Pantanalinema sp. GBBB05]